MTSRSLRGSSETTVVGVELTESLESILPRADSVWELLESADRGRPERGFMNRIGVFTRYSDVKGNVFSIPSFLAVVLLPPKTRAF